MLCEGVDTETGAGGAGAGLDGARIGGACEGGLGAGLLGIRTGGAGPFAVVKPLVDAPLGMGGGALGFSKLPSWFCGKRGLAGGDIMPPPTGEKGADTMPVPGVIGP